MSAQVTPQYLLRGAIYALEQCGLLLRDANTLYRSGSYATALALAAFAREELGHWTILLAVRDRVLTGERLTIIDVQMYGKDHVRKQEAGMKGLMFSADQSSSLGRLIVARMSAAPGSAEWKAADDQLTKLSKLKQKRLPDDRHKQRMSTLYVDAVSVHQWNRPSRNVARLEAYEFVRAAVNDYATPYDQQYSNLEFIERSNPQWLQVLQEWPDRPELPAPEWPSYPE